MRDAVGGTFMMYIFIIFLVVFITFVAVAFNYARAFRVKNAVMDIIEQNEGIDYSNASDTAMVKIEEYLNNVSYNVDGIESSNEICNGLGNDTSNLYISESGTTGRGFCIYRVGDFYSDHYYKVVTFVRLEIPFLENLAFTIPIKGETRKIEKVA